MGPGEIEVRYKASDSLTKAPDSGPKALDLPFTASGVRALFAHSPLKVRDIHVASEAGNTEVKFALDFATLEDLTKLQTFDGHQIRVSEEGKELRVVRTIEPIPEIKEKMNPESSKDGSSLLNLLTRLGGNLSRLKFKVELFFPVIQTDGTVTEPGHLEAPHTITWDFPVSQLGDTGVEMNVTVEKPFWLTAVLEGSTRWLTLGGWRWMVGCLVLGGFVWFRGRTSRGRRRTNLPTIEG